MIAHRKTFGQELGRLRRGLVVSRESLAGSAELSKGYLALLEQGHRRPSGGVVDRLADALQLASPDRSRLRVRAVLDRISDELSELGTSDLDVIESVADSLLLFAGDSEADAAEILLLDTDEELRLKAARHLGHVLRRVAERWRHTHVLTMPEYFRAIIAAMDSSDLIAVTAINTIDPRRWIEDQREVRYLEANARAVERGTRLRRLFIVDASVHRRDLQRVSRAHETAGVLDVRWLSSSYISKLADMAEDAVLFESKTSRSMFVGHADPEDALRVEFGERVTSEGEIGRFGQYFDLLFRSAAEEIVI